MANKLEKGENYPVEILYAHDNVESGLFVLYQNEGHSQGPVIDVFALEGYETLLEAELRNWTFLWTLNKLVFYHVLERHVPVIKSLMNVNKYILKKSMIMKYFSMPIDMARKLDIECPEDVEFGQLQEHHLTDIFHRWYLKNEYSFEELKNWHKHSGKFAIGLFSKKNGDLLASVMRAYSGMLSSLMTAEPHQGKGYAKLLMKKACKMLAEDSIEPFTSVAETNVPSLAVMRRVGFINVFDGAVFYYYKED